jgi:esterase/lipase
MKSVFLFLLFFLNLFELQAQIDTSYTVFSTYNKEIKKFPFIKIKKENKQKNLNSSYDLVYNTIESRELHLDAYFKIGKIAHPAVILIHGGGWKSGNKSQMKIFAQEIASKGYSCFAVEYRLSPEAKYPAAIFDVKNAIKFIKRNTKKFNVNSNKVAVLGCSSGGQMAALVGTTNNNTGFEDNNGLNKNSSVQAIVDIDGILAFKHPESEEGKVASEWLGGTYEEQPEIWKQAAALSHVDKNTPPMLFMNSDMLRFHAGRDDMIAVLNQYKIYNEVKNIHNSPHSFWFFEPWFTPMVDYTIQFLDKTLKNK